MDLSVIIVNWNTKKLLEDCLTSIFKFSESVSFEVIVVDNGSTDASSDMVKKKFPQVKLILNKDNLGFTKANNQGIKIAKGDFVLLLNSDTYLVENSLKKMVEEARNVNNLGALGPKLLNEDKTIQQSAGFLPNMPQIFFWMTFIDDLPLGYLLKPFHVDHDSFYNKTQIVGWVTGAAILVPKKIIKEVGALDEKIFMYGEDVEWSARIQKAGHKIFFSPTTKIVHIGRGSHNKISQAAFIGEYQGLIYFYKKYRGALPLQILRLFLKMGALLRIVIFGILGRKELARAYGKVYKVA